MCEWFLINYGQVDRVTIAAQSRVLDIAVVFGSTAKEPFIGNEEMSVR